MPSIDLLTVVKAPVERVFDLSRSIDLHVASTVHTGEKAVAGVTSGLIAMNQVVTWQARHFGISQRLTTRITAYERPGHFRDTMVHGAFKRFDHDHFFTATLEGATMRDVFDYTAPWGPLGRAADVLFLENYMRRLLLIRNAVIKQAAESHDWKKYLSEADGG